MTLILSVICLLFSQSFPVIGEPEAEMSSTTEATMQAPETQQDDSSLASPDVQAAGTQVASSIQIPISPEDFGIQPLVPEATMSELIPDLFGWNAGKARGSNAFPILEPPKAVAKPGLIAETKQTEIRVPVSRTHSDQAKAMTTQPDVPASKPTSAAKTTTIASNNDSKSKPAPQSKLVSEPQVKPKENSQGHGLVSRIWDATKSLVTRALGWLGTRYVWGGTSAKGVDCSGLTQSLYKSQGIKLPHNAKAQFKLGKPVPRDALVPGDLVFFNTRGPLTHVGMYIGEGKFIHAANPKRGVRIDSLSSRYYNSRYAGARRYIDMG